MSPLIERSPEAKRAYVDGFKAGGELVLAQLRRGSAIQEAEDFLLTTHGLIVESVRSFKYEDD